MLWGAAHPAECRLRRCQPPLLSRSACCPPPAGREHALHRHRPRQQGHQYAGMLVRRPQLGRIQAPHPQVRRPQPQDPRSRGLAPSGPLIQASQPAWGAASPRHPRFRSAAGLATGAARPSGVPPSMDDPPPLPVAIFTRHSCGPQAAGLPVGGRGWHEDAGLQRQPAVGHVVCGAGAGGGQPGR